MWSKISKLLNQVFLILYDVNTYSLTSCGTRKPSLLSWNQISTSPKALRNTITGIILHQYVSHITLNIIITFSIGGTTRSIGTIILTLMASDNTQQNIDPFREYEQFNFLYSSSNIGKEAVDQLVKLFMNYSIKIIINLGLSGDGKTHLVTQLAVQGKALVLFYDCSQNSKLIGTIIKNYWEGKPREWRSNYEDFSSFLELTLFNFTIANAFTLLQLVKLDKTLSSCAI